MSTISLDDGPAAAACLICEGPHHPEFADAIGADKIGVDAIDAIFHAMVQAQDDLTAAGVPNPVPAMIEIAKGIGRVAAAAKAFGARRGKYEFVADMIAENGFGTYVVEIAPPLPGQRGVMRLDRWVDPDAPPRRSDA